MKTKKKLKNSFIEELIENKIYFIREEKVMLDFDLAELYRVKTKALNQAVKRNIKRFPNDFMFKLNTEETFNLKSQIVTSSSSEYGGRRKPIYAFTEQGIAMLSSVLKSNKAIEVNIKIIRIFTKLRKILLSQQELVEKIKSMETKYENLFHTIFEILQQMNEKEVLTKKDQIGFRTK